MKIMWRKVEVESSRWKISPRVFRRDILAHFMVTHYELAILKNNAIVADLY